MIMQNEMKNENEGEGVLTISDPYHSSEAPQTLSDSGASKLINLISTAELVEELSRKEGVERFNIAPHTQVVDIDTYAQDRYSLKLLSSVRTEGPCIVLKVIG